MKMLKHIININNSRMLNKLAALSQFNYEPGIFNFLPNIWVLIGTVYLDCSKKYFQSIVSINCYPNNAIPDVIVDFEKKKCFNFMA